MFNRLLGRKIKDISSNYLSEPTSDLTANGALNLIKSTSNFIFDHFTSEKENYSFNTGAMNNVKLQGCSYGASIPLIFGKAKLAGSIIWMPPFDSEYIEDKHTGEYSNVDLNSAKTAQYNGYIEYYADMAVAICEGPVDELTCVQASGEKIDLTSYKYRFYHGTESQQPDPLIESHVGRGKAPAYRGICYIVFEKLPLSDFNGVLPSLVFEVIKKSSDNNLSRSPEKLINSVAITPPAGEYIYHTTKIRKYIKGELGYEEKVNYSPAREKTYSELSLEQLLETFPNLEWVSSNVCWYGDNLDIAGCIIAPRVESCEEITHFTQNWQVAGIKRNKAREITGDSLEAPIYDGTPSDDSILAYLDMLKQNNLKVMFSPSLRLDLEDKPWRGNLTGKDDKVREFFRKKGGYNEFILHYAHLVKNKVDAFLIGSELAGLTSIKDSCNSFPAISELENLTGQVKNILGKEVYISYAASYLEYHHEKRGWYNLDELWASPHIDFVGINAYFPLTLSGSSNICEEDIKRGWCSGEHYDYYFSDDKPINLKADQAEKNIRWWWENEHVNPDGKKTSWRPKSKPIWFTEYGFPSIDKATNKPDTPADINQDGAAIPAYSSAQFDPQIQRMAIKATEELWQNNDMVTNKFLYGFDIRPYPQWPETEDWLDSSLWKYGHYINGKLGSYCPSISEILTEFSNRSGIASKQLKFNNINARVPACIFSESSSILSYIEDFKTCFNIKSRINNNIVEFINPGNTDFCQTLELSRELEHSNSGVIRNFSSEELVGRVYLNFFNMDKEQEVTSLITECESRIDSPGIRANLPIVLASREADVISNNIIKALNSEIGLIDLVLPLEYYQLAPGDKIILQIENNINTNLGNFNNIYLNVKTRELVDYKIYVRGGILDEFFV